MRCCDRNCHSLGGRNVEALRLRQIYWPVPYSKMAENTIKQEKSMPQSIRVDGIFLTDFAACNSLSIINNDGVVINPLSV